MVTGGWTGSDNTDTTETLASDEDMWTTAGARLPRPMSGQRAATIDDRILIFGNYTFIYHTPDITGDGFHGKSDRKIEIIFLSPKTFLTPSWDIVMRLHGLWNRQKPLLSLPEPIPASLSI